MNNAIGLKLQPAPTVDAGQIMPNTAITSELDCACETQDQGDFFEVLNVELEALVDTESVDFLALASPLEDIENLENIEDVSELELPQLVLVDLLPIDETPKQPLKLEEENSLLLDEDMPEVTENLEVLFQQALTELPKIVTALPLTPENKVFIQQQALAIVEQKDPELMAKIQLKEGQELPLEGKLLPLVDEALRVNDAVKTIRPDVLINPQMVKETSNELNIIASNKNELSKNELSKNESIIKDNPLIDSITGDKDSELEADLSFKELLETTKGAEKQSPERQTLSDIAPKNLESKEVPIPKFTTEAVSTSLNNALGANQATVNTANASTVQSGATLQLPQNPSPEQWGSALGDKVQWMINTKMDSAEIRIDPPHLGKMDISIKMTDDGAQVVIQTHHAATRELVDAASYRLKEMLEQAGHEHVDVDVSHKESNQSESQFSQNDENNEQQSTSYLNNNEQQEIIGQDIVKGSFQPENMGLDLFA